MTNGQRCDWISTFTWGNVYLLGTPKYTNYIFITYTLSYKKTIGNISKGALRSKIGFQIEHSAPKPDCRRELRVHFGL